MSPTVAVARSALLVVGLAVGLSACGGTGEVEEPGASSGTNSAETTTTGDSDTVTPPGTFTLEEDGALATGAEGPAVRRLQEALLTLGFDPGAVDGIFGPGTHRAVIDFQQENGLEADGIVGQQTADAINQALERGTTPDG